ADVRPPERDVVPRRGAPCGEVLADRLLVPGQTEEGAGEQQAEAHDRSPEHYAGCDGPGEEVGAVFPMKPSHEENVMPTPSKRPARTSLGRCTPRKMRSKPTARARTVPAPTTSRRTSTDISGQRRKTSAVTATAMLKAWPEGKE